MISQNTNWPFYFSLESDVLNLSRYIEFNEDNFGVYSIELLRLYLSICSEVDVVLKQICAILNGEAKAENITQYRKVISQKSRMLCEQLIACQKFEIQFKPWNIWLNNDTPEWWRFHNKLKHNRNKHYPKATLGNVLESLAALYSVNMYLAFVEANKQDPGSFFMISNVVSYMPIQHDFYRLNDPHAYISEF